MNSRPNQLELYLEKHRIPETRAMNLLQEHGIVSDNCVTAAEVVDIGKAISWLNLNYEKHT
jgi:hypothetical protein